jgi:predicted nucleotidyltransferase
MSDNRRIAQLLSECRWPPLNARYDAALREATAYIIERFSPHGIVASGSIIRGNPDATSDFDLYVIHDASWRQRVQKYFNSVPAEIFVNPPHQIERYFDEEQRDGRPMTAHMLATGFIVLDRQGTAADLRQRARLILDQPMDVSPDQQVFQRYMLANRFEDAADIAAHSPENADLILGHVVYDLLNYAFFAANRSAPRHKELLKHLEIFDPELARLAYAFYRAASTAERLDLAGHIADHTIGARGFFEWETPPQDVPPPE